MRTLMWILLPPLLLIFVPIAFVFYFAFLATVFG